MGLSVVKVRARFVRGLACLFLGAIVADLALDGNCDPPETVVAAATSVTASGPAGAQDSCARVCVPDCYCCSHSVAYGPSTLPPDAGPVRLAPAPRPVAVPAGVLPLPYHPPRSLA
jgi:hypothetical protein